jgi:hypothetical protein
MTNLPVRWHQESDAQHEKMGNSPKVSLVGIWWFEEAS